MVVDVEVGEEKEQEEEEQKVEEQKVVEQEAEEQKVGQITLRIKEKIK